MKRNYEKMVILHGSDRATRQEDETASEMRKRQHSAAKEDFTETFNDLDNLFWVTLENTAAILDGDDDNISNFSDQELSPRVTSGTNKKKKRVAATKEEDTEFEVIKGAISEIADALREGNAIMRDIYNYKLPPISGEETWNLIKESGYDINLLPQVYCFLTNDVNKLRAVIQCPAEVRKAVIMQMVFGC